MYIFRLIVVVALLTFDLSSNKELPKPEETTTEITSLDPCLLGQWRVDIPSMAIALDRPVSGSIVFAFERSPVNEITASFDVTIRRRPPQTQRREHFGTLSATVALLPPERGSGRFKLTNVDFGDENSHKRYKADGDWRDIEDSTKEFFKQTMFTYQDCTPTMMVGMHTIKLDKVP